MRPRRHRQVPERGEKRLRKECPAETLPRESPIHRHLRESPHHRPPREAEAGEDGPVRWEPSLRDREACGELIGDVHGKLRHSIRPDV